MGCDPRCYVDNKGCAISIDGKCAIIYPVENEGSTVKTFQEAFKEMVKNRKIYSPSDKNYFQIHSTRKKIAP